MTALITGGAGFLGLYLVREHLVRNKPVTILAHAGSPSARDRCVDFLVETGDINRLARPLDDLLTVVEVDICAPLLGLSRANHQQLARSASMVWHVAGAILLDGRDEHVWSTNYVGTQHVLELASEASAEVALHHVSTAAVAGSRTGFVREDDVTDDLPFRNTYEKSKFAAEQLVREWASTRNRSATIYRPSLLIPSHRLMTPGMPQHTLGTVCAIMESLLAELPDAASRIPVRVHGTPRARLNLLQVGWSAAAMMQAAEHQGDGVSTIHIVHPDDVHARIVAAALEDLFPVRVRMVPALPNDPSPLEHAFYREMRGFLRYMQQSQRFDDSRLRSATPDLEPPRQIDRGYLTYHLADRTPTTPR